MAGETSFGGYQPIEVGRFSAEKLAQDQRNQGYDRFFRPGSAIRPMEKQGIVERLAAEAQRTQADQRNKQTSLVARERDAESQQEGNIAFGRIGRNVPGDTRLAEVLAALGVQPDLMRAIIASAQLKPGANRNG